MRNYFLEKIKRALILTHSLYLFQRGKGLLDGDRIGRREMILEGMSCCMKDLINEVEQA